MGSSAAGWAGSSELEGPKHSKKMPFFDNPAPILGYVLQGAKDSFTCPRYCHGSVGNPTKFVPQLTPFNTISHQG